MKTWKQLFVGIGAGLFATVLILPQAKGELVLEEDLPQQEVETQSTSIQVEGEKTAAQAQTVSPTLIQKIEQTQNAIQSTSQETTQENQSRTELLRRARMREEVKNEDILQTRLEELRLRDEQKRADQILNVNADNGATVQAVQQQQVVSQPVEEIVVKDATTVSTESVAEFEVDEADDELQISLRPLGGLSGMFINGPAFDVKGRFSAGVAASFGVSDHLSLEFGYLYSEYGINFSNGGFTGASRDDLVMKQNSFDMHLKTYLLGRSSKIRPFVSAGVGYSLSFINYDDRLRQIYAYQGYPSLDQDYQIGALTGGLAAGVDVQLSKNISVGAAFKFTKVFTARETFDDYQSGYSGYYGAYGYPSYYYSSDPNKEMVGSSLAQTSFYSILVNFGFTF